MIAAMMLFTYKGACCCDTLQALKLHLATPTHLTAFKLCLAKHMNSNSTYLACCCNVLKL